MTHWSFGASAGILFLGGLLWLTAGWLSFQNWRRSGRRPMIATLEGLRFTLVTLLAFTLLRPEVVRLIQRVETPEVVILTDASGSMKTRDVAAGTNLISRAEWLERERKAEFWKPLEKTAKVSVEDFAAVTATTNALTAASAGTDLNRALDNVFQRQKNLKAVLLLTDGDWNEGKSPVGAAMRFREQNVPIFAATVGRETPVPDLILESVSPPSYGLFGEQISIPFRLVNHLPREIKTTVTLEDEGRQDTQKEITIPAMSDWQDAVLWSPRKVGDASLKLRVPVQPDEGLAENNEKSFRVGVRVETLKVLVVDSLPRWEYRYLRNALARDPGVEMNCILFHPGMEAGGGKYYLSGFPGTKELISRYDVIFLGDVGVGEGELTEKDCELIKGLVEQQSSGLVFLPGRRGREVSLLTGPLKDLYPVVLDEAKADGLGLVNESTLILSTLGKRHLLTRFDADESRNDEIWKQLPGFFWSAAVEKSRPGSEVLAVHSSQRNEWGRMPLLVSRSAGAGKVLFMGTDSAWRWRRGVEDKFHYRFWSQVVRWMAHQRHLSEKQGVRLSYSPEAPSAGDTVFLQCTVFDASGFPIEEGPVTGKITAPSGRTERLEFQAMEGGWGVFKSSFLAQEGGAYKIAVAAERHGRQLETDLTVVQPVREKVGQPVNAEILREISVMTRGGNVSYEALDKLVQQISVLPEPRPLERRIRIWSDPRWGGLILLLLGFYWVGRKLAGLV
ncbi:MAG TPA: vWA domain-containing protein [Verrucomicrobiae bacterium]|nr:vWA domain-containing protein [Verrucomicrobiae bacterium]